MAQIWIKHSGSWIYYCHIELSSYAASQTINDLIAQNIDYRIQ